MLSNKVGELSTSGSLEDPREAEKGVSHTRFSPTIEHSKGFVKVSAG